MFTAPALTQAFDAYSKLKARLAQVEGNKKKLEALIERADMFNALLERIQKKYKTQEPDLDAALCQVAKVLKSITDFVEEEEAKKIKIESEVPESSIGSAITVYELFSSEESEKKIESLTGKLNSVRDDLTAVLAAHKPKSACLLQ